MSLTTPSRNYLDFMNHYPFPVEQSRFFPLSASLFFYKKKKVLDDLSMAEEGGHILPKPIPSQQKKRCPLVSSSPDTLIYLYACCQGHLCCRICAFHPYVLNLRRITCSSNSVPATESLNIFSSRDIWLQSAEILQKFRCKPWVPTTPCTLGKPRPLNGYTEIYFRELFMFRSWGMST